MELNNVMHQQPNHMENNYSTYYCRLWRKLVHTSVPFIHPSFLNDFFVLFFGGCLLYRNIVFVGIQTNESELQWS